MYEGDLFLLHALFRGGNKGDWQGRWEFWNSALSRHDMDRSKLPGPVPDFATAALSVWNEYAGGAQVMGEKSPDYYDCMQVLARDFPNARFLVIWRDLADTCRSMVRARTGASFFSKPGLLHRAILGYHKMKLECDALTQSGIPLHQIQYEEMVQDPTRVMQGVCDFLGIEFDPRMASLEGSDRSAIYQGTHHEHVKGEQILGSREREEVLPAKVKDKVARYVSYWRKQSGGNWPRYAKAVDDRGVSSFERLGDELLFRALRAVDSFTQAVYCYAPYSALEKHRAGKARRHAESLGEPVPEQSPVENVHP